MMKVTKYDKEKQRQNRANYRKEIRERKHGVCANLIYAVCEIWHTDKLAIFVNFCFAVALYLRNLCTTFTDKYVVELAGTGLEDTQLLVICVSLIAGNVILLYFQSTCNNYFGSVGNLNLYQHFLLKLAQKNMRMDYENNERPEIADKKQKAQSSIGVIMWNTPINLRGTLRHTLEILTYSALLATLDSRILPIVILPQVAVFYINRHKMQWVWNMQDNWQRYDRELDYVNHVSKSFAKAKDIRIFGIQNLFDGIFSRSLSQRMNWIKQQDAWEFRHDLLINIISFFANLSAYGLLIFLVARSHLSAGEFVLYFNSVFMLKNAAADWCNNMSGYQWISGNINNFREYMETEDRTNRGKGVPIPAGECEITFKNVTYKYAGSEKAVINHMSFTLHKGEKLALVGLNGAGKTTIVKLICGLYDATEGEILLNGVNIQEYNREEYFSLFSTVFQDVFTLAASIAENISSQPLSLTDKAKVFECMKKSGIYEKVMSLPEQENTPLVRSTYNHSIDLSGGEMQKLALAKALYKDAPVLLLDEPTAALDAIAEQEMYLSYAEFAKAKTSLFISHRLASTRFCDRIIFIDNGTVAECGTHSQLMEAGGKYAALFKLQSSYYSDEGGAI